MLGGVQIPVPQQLLFDVSLSCFLYRIFRETYKSSLDTLRKEWEPYAKIGQRLLNLPASLKRRLRSTVLSSLTVWYVWLSQLQLVYRIIGGLRQQLREEIQNLHIPDKELSRLRFAMSIRALH